MIGKAAFQRKVMRVLFRERARWPDLLVVVSDASDEVRLEDRPAGLPRPRTGHVWFTEDSAERAYQLDAITAGRALGMR